MRPTCSLPTLLATLLLVAGCGSDDSTTAHDAGPAHQDAASGVDAGARDAGPGRDGGTPTADGSTPGTDGGGGGATLSDAHPGDVGMGDDPDVVWFEDFEEGSIPAIQARYDDFNDNGRWSLVSDTPSGSGSALALRAGQGQNAVDFFKRLPDSDEWYVRWYAHYEAGVPWHHSGVHFGGRNPPLPYPVGSAGLLPTGDDHFGIAIEPAFDVGAASPRFDFYNYWMKMHSWMAPPINNDGTAYYGNTLVHQNGFTTDDGTWVCLEVHVRLNPDPSSGAGAVLEVWKNDTLVQRFDDSGPMGYWIRDKFCPEGADGSECTDYPAPATDILDLQFRSTTDLHLNSFWPQNYITDPAMGTLIFDQMVVATRRVGCMR